MTDSVNLSGYHLTFDAEMTSAADAALFSYTFINGDRTIAGNSEAETYYDYSSSSYSPFTFNNGAVTITATPVTGGTLPYSSGLLSTANTFSQNQGYFEIRAQVPDAKGFWSAFWMLSRDYAAEVDILEQPNNDGATRFFDSIKTSDYNAGAFQETGTDLGTGFHTYGFMWTSSTVQFTFDGKYIGYAVPTPAGLTGEKLYMLANLAVGGYGSWPGQPASGASASYAIDYIRAFSNDPTVPGVAQETVSSPDGVDTTPALLPVLGTVGSGSHALALQFNEDAFQGDAQITVAVDGVQQGGTFTISASRAFKQTQTLVVQGAFGPGAHALTVTFLNDLYAGAGADRNVYLAGASLDGAVLQNSTLSLLANGSQSVGFRGIGTALAYAPDTLLSVGKGSDTLSLLMSEDAYNGDAQFTVSVDGVQAGGVQTVSALHRYGGSQQFDIAGSFAAGPHTVAVTFLNDAYGYAANTDRNLYVTGALLNGVAVPSSSLAEYSNGTQSFGFVRPATDTLTVGVSEDAYQGDAQYHILVDGVALPATYTATASHAAGMVTQQTVTGNWGRGAHTLGIQFINDAYGGSASADRNLYINSVNYDGAVLPTGVVPQTSAGTATFAIPAASSLTLHLAEDAYAGDAQFSLSVDGQQVLASTAVSASHAAGASQAVVVPVALSAGMHDVAVSFLNDAWGGSAAADRNLYVVGAELNGTPLSATTWTAGLYSNGTSHFSLLVPSS